MLPMKRMAFALLAPLMLSGCLLLPGQFDASLRLMNDGRYTFEYVGEMQLFAGDDKEMSPPKDEPFDPAKAYCSTYIDSDGTRDDYSEYRRWDDEGAMEATAPAAFGDEEEDLPRTVERDCTKEELAELREEQQERFERKQQEYQQKSGMVAAMFGGAVPGNDEALRKFAADLAKYDGWDKVEYIGNNKFAVEYRASGRFDRYFAFPVLPDAASQFPFFHIVPRGDGRLEILSPAIGNMGSGNMLALMMAGMRAESDGPNLSEINGSFTLETDGKVAANNAPDGFVEGADGIKTMRWNIGEGGAAAPRALIQLGG